MRHYILAIAAILCSQQAVAQSQLLEYLRDAASDGVVFIAVQGLNKNNVRVCETGTGFVVTKDGRVITAAHLLSDGDVPYKDVRIRVKVGNRFECFDPTGVVFAATEVARSGLDAILINIQEDVQLQGIAICPSATPSLGEELFVAGFPLSQSLKIMRGTEGSDNGPRGLHEIDMAVNEGLSGAPIFDSQGRVVGMYKGGLEVGESQSYMVPGNQLFPLVDSSFLRDGCWAAEQRRPKAKAEGWLRLKRTATAPPVGSILPGPSREIKLRLGPFEDATSHNNFFEGLDAEVLEVATSPSGEKWIFVGTFKAPPMSPRGKWTEEWWGPDK